MMVPVLGALLLLGAAAPDFVRDVHPFFASSCVRCHGPSVRKGLFRLDTRARRFFARGSSFFAKMLC